MSPLEEAIAKIRHLPDSLAQEVSDFIDFLQMRHDQKRWQLWLQYQESAELSDVSLDDYFPNLETYEDQLARGEIKW